MSLTLLYTYSHQYRVGKDAQSKSCSAKKKSNRPQKSTVKSETQSAPLNESSTIENDRPKHITPSNDGNY